MSMLERIKKRYQDGFKEFVLSLETSPSKVRGQIFLAGLLEDPVFMSHVVKNTRNFDDIIGMSSEDLAVIVSQDRQYIGLLAMGLSSCQDKMRKFEGRHPEHAILVKKELGLLNSISPNDVEHAQQFFIKLARKYQTQGKIKGFDWALPPQHLYALRKVSDGPVRIQFENGSLAAQGSCVRGKREGKWQHFYETGALLAEGHYVKGQKDGEWKFFFSNGAPKSLGEFKFDTRDGLWIDWDRLGEISESVYEQGVKKND